MEEEPVNEYGVPLHACNGYRHDEHYWAWKKHQIDTNEGAFYDWLRAMRKEDDGRTQVS